MTTTEWKELKSKLYVFGRMSDRQELSDTQEEIEEMIEALIAKAETDAKREVIEVVKNSRTVEEQFGIGKREQTAKVLSI